MATHFINKTALAAVWRTPECHPVVLTVETKLKDGQKVAVFYPQTVFSDL
jgi:hypothetical protein